MSQQAQDKRCTKCGEGKPQAEFARDASSEDGLQKWCKACRRAYYQANRERWRGYQDAEYQRAWCAANTTANRAYLDDLKKTIGCQDCGRRPDDLGRLHWHHLDKATKVRSVSSMMSRSRKELDTEIAKCDLLCEPCHVERHRLMRGEAHD